MTNKLSFTVTVTACQNCPSHMWEGGIVSLCNYGGYSQDEAIKRANENFDELTESCPEIQWRFK